MRITRFSAWVLVLAGIGGLALAQGLPTATLTGKVTTEGDVALPGVTVTVESPNLQGKRETTTSASGDYNFNLLPPGEYRVTFALSGMTSVNRTVTLLVAQTTRHDAVLNPSPVAEALTVSGAQGEAAALESPQVAANYSKEFIEKLPVGRTLAATTLLAPGVTNNGPGGNDRLASIAISGAPSFENLFLINGVVVNENLRGQPHDLFIEDAIQETTVLTGNISAEYGRFSGGVVSAITKSGGNRLSGSFRTSMTNDDWSANDPFNSRTGDRGVAAARADPRINKNNPVYEATLGGPFWKDHIWFFGAGRKAETSTSRETRPTQNVGSINPTAIPYTNVRDTQRLEGKLTIQPFAGHNLVGSYIDIEDEEVNNSFTTNILDTASLVTRQTPNTLMAVNYSGVLTNNLFIEAQYSQKEFTFENTGSPFRDLLRGTLLLDLSRAQARYNSPTFANDTPEQRDNKSWLGKVSYFLSTSNLGTHDIRLGYEYFHDLRFADNFQSGSDFRIFGTSAYIRGTDVFPVFRTPGDSTFIRWNPIAQRTLGTDFNTHSVFLNDRWSFKNWSFNLGVRYDKNDGVDSNGFKTSDDDAISPRLAAQFDPKGNGRLIFNAGYGQYVALLSDSIADQSSPAGRSATVDWFYRGPCINCDPNAPTSELLNPHQAIQAVFDWFNSIGGTGSTPTRLSSVPGVSTQILEGSLTSPNVKEYTAGVGMALGTRGFAKVDFIHRNWDDYYGTRTDLGTGLAPRDQYGNQTDLTLVINEDRYDRKYNAVQTQLSVRPLEGLFVGGNYTWSRLTGNFEAENLVSGPVTGAGASAYPAPGDYPEYKNFAQNLPEGYLTGDQRHRAALWVGYDIPTSFADFNVTVLQHYGSGIAFSGNGAIDTRPATTNPGYASPPPSVDYFFAPRGGFRTDDITRTDLAVNMNFRLWKTLELFLQPELLNVFNEDGFNGGRIGTDSNVTVNTRVNAGTAFQNFDPRTTAPVEGVHYAFHPNFGRAISRDGYQLPRTFRISAGVRF
jgi:hypothetical protein